MSKKGKGHSRKEELSSVTYGGTTYLPNDCVLINPDANAPAYVARIRRIVQQGDDEQSIELDVTWFYRPEEAVGGRKSFHGVDEVFESDHHDKAHVQTIMGKCNVYSIREYEELAVREENDFYSRFTYKPKLKQFEPDSAPVYCKCETPYNPDKPMCLCVRCGEWYHPECLGVRRKDVEQVLHQMDFVCVDCQASNNQPRKKASTGSYYAGRQR